MDYRLLAVLVLAMAVSYKAAKSTGSIVVVGAGLAGLVAAAEIVTKGHQVYLIEKEKFSGGNSRKATSGLNAAGSRAQASLSIQDSIDAFVDDIVASGGGLTDKDLATQVARLSTSAVEFIEQVTGLSLSQVTQLGGHSSPRTHRLPADGPYGPIGVEVIRRLMAFLEASDLFHFVPDAKLEDIHISGNRVTGIDLNLLTGKETWSVSALVLATGGYGAARGEDGILRRVPSAELTVSRHMNC